MRKMPALTWSTAFPAGCCCSFLSFPFLSLLTSVGCNLPYLLHLTSQAGATFWVDFGTLMGLYKRDDVYEGDNDTVSHTLISSTMTMTYIG